MKIFDIKKMTPAEQIAFVITRIYDQGMTTLSGGNISLMDENGDLWITPSGIDKGSLTAADIVCVRADGSIEGKHKPSSEYPFHKALLGERPAMKAVLHAHPPALVAFSMVKRVPDTRISPQIFANCGEMGFAQYDLPGSAILGERIADEFKAKPSINAVIMENHGTVLCGKDLADAYLRFDTLEYSSRMELGAIPLGGHKSLDDKELGVYKAAAQSYLAHTSGTDNGDTELKEGVCAFARRCCRQGMMMGNMGVISARIDGGNDFVITPAGALERWDLQAEDIVTVKGGKCFGREGVMVPEIVALHASVYESYPEVNSIMNASPVNVMSYAIASQSFNVRTIPESWILLKDVPLMPFATQFINPEAIVESLASNPAVIIENEGLMVTGSGMLHAFDRMEVAELSAKSLIMAAPLGELCPINCAQVEELRVAFKVK